jgi:hypothetical protein
MKRITESSRKRTGWVKILGMGLGMALISWGTPSSADTGSGDTGPGFRPEPNPNPGWSLFSRMTAQICSWPAVAGEMAEAPEEVTVSGLWDRFPRFHVLRGNVPGALRVRSGWECLLSVFP